MKLKCALSCSISAIGLLTATAAAAQQAAAPPAATAAQPKDNGQLNEIIVTARRVSENLQTVPVSVTNVTAGDLVARGTTTIEQVALGTPNVAVSPGAAASNSAVISIRGQIQTDNLITVDPSVGVYVDDVYYARAYAVLGDLLDVNNVEVLKGPQGTLYGRNTIGGAIKVTTQRPDPNGEYSGYLRASYGNYNAVDATGAINIPIIPGKIAIRYAGSYHNHDGYTNSYLLATNPNTGVSSSLTPVQDIHTNNLNTFSHRLSLRAMPNDALTIDVSGSIFHADDNGGMSVNLDGDIQHFQGVNSPSGTYSYSPQRQSSFYSALTNSVPFDDTTVKALESTTELKLSDAATMKLILGYIKSENSSAQNTSGTVTTGLAFIQFQPDTQFDQHQFSAEYQILGKLFDQKLSYIFGLYYFKETGHDQSPNGTTYVFDANNSNNFASIGRNKSESAFGDLIYAFTDSLRVNGGLRYTTDIKAIDGQSRVISAGQPGVCEYAAGPGITTSTTNGGPCDFIASNTYHYTTFEVGADYRVNHDVFLYVKAGNGYRSGGQQARAIGGASLIPFQPDKVMNYEGGIKSELFDRRLRLNLTYFHTDFTNTQQTLVLLVPNSAGVPTTTTAVVNQGSAKIDGIEADSILRVGKQLTLSGGVGYSDFRYANPALVQPLSPKWTYQVAATYVQPTSIGKFTGRVDYAYRSSSYLAGATAGEPENQLNAFGLLNGRLSLDLPYGLQLAGFMKNITGKKYYSYGILTGYTPAYNFYGVRGMQVGAPRTFGVEASVKF